MAMNTIEEVANWFLSKSTMTHKKLQKLCYYAQAWHCALLGIPLFTEEFQAWVHGPVSPSLYPKYADYKWNDIPQQFFDESCFSEKTLKVLRTVYNTYGSFTGDELERLTHSETPWKNARGDLEPWENCTEIITTDEMKIYYGKLYADTQND